MDKYLAQIYETTCISDVRTIIKCCQWQQIQSNHLFTDWKSEIFIIEADIRNKNENYLYKKISFGIVVYFVQILCELYSINSRMNYFT